MADIQVIVLDEEPVTIIETSAQGPPGAAPRISAVAGEDIPAYCVIRADASGAVFIADYEEDLGEIIGLSISAAVAGAEVLYTIGGVRIPLLGATPGARYFLGSAGALTTTPPDNGLLKLMCICHEANYVVVSPGPTIRRRVWQ
jgi:hypothetical protein